MLTTVNARIRFIRQLVVPGMTSISHKEVEYKETLCHEGNYRSTYRCLLGWFKRGNERSEKVLLLSFRYPLASFINFPRFLPIYTVFVRIQNKG